MINRHTALNELEFSSNAEPTLDEVKTAYKRLAKKYHPDKSLSEEANTKFSKISEAYKFLLMPRDEQDHPELADIMRNYNHTDPSATLPIGYNSILIKTFLKGYVFLRPVYFKEYDDELSTRNLTRDIVKFSEKKSFMNYSNEEFLMSNIPNLFNPKAEKIILMQSPRNYLTPRGVAILAHALKKCPKLRELEDHVHAFSHEQVEKLS